MSSITNIVVMGDWSDDTNIINRFIDDRDERSKFEKLRDLHSKASGSKVFTDHLYGIAINYNNTLTEDLIELELNYDSWSLVTINFEDWEEPVILYKSPKDNKLKRINK